MIRLALMLAVCGIAVITLSCGGGETITVPSPPTPSPETLTAAEVQTVIQKAAEAADKGYVIAVTDRGGTVLGVYRKAGAPATATGNFGTSYPAEEGAIGLARTASFFSNDQAPLSSRTVRFISGIHFPPGIRNVPSAALYGIENTNRGCPLNANFSAGMSVSPARSLNGTALGTGVVTGKADAFDSDANAVNPGGVPLFKNGKIVGGVGVAGTAPEIAEFAAFSGVAGSGLVPAPAPPGVVVIDGVSLPFVNQTTRPAGTNAGAFNGTFVFGPIASPGPVPEGDLVAPAAGPLGGLTQAEVQQILDRAVETANQTRAVIRLPIGQRARFVIAVADLDGRIIGLRRMPDATVFSIDVAVGKARNMVYFSSTGVNPADMPGVPAGTAVTNRTLSFAGQPLFPSGIDGSEQGPFFQSLFLYDLANPCTNGRQPANPNQNGIVFFPGSVPLYRGDRLVGGLGVSGDGVEQDDFVSDRAAQGFEAPAGIRADNILINGVRLPYLKFPRNPTF